MSPDAVVAHLPSLRRYARALTGDVWTADDLVQDTLERACSRWRLWLAGSDLRAWLFTIMHNLYVSQLRQRTRRGQAVDVDDLQPELQAPAHDPATAIDLQRCLLGLPQEQRAVLLLVTLEDLSYADVAKITGTPVGTVMSRLSRARERLRELMDAGSAPRQTAPVLKRLK